MNLMCICGTVASSSIIIIILKFYECTAGLLRKYCAELDSDPVMADFPFRLSPLEHAVCDLHPSPPSSVLLLGRSGTGRVVQ